MSDIATNEAIPEITLGWRLRIAMERAGIKAGDMAAELGVHGGTITRWTHDIGAAPRPIYLERWAAMCGVPAAWLRGDLYADPTGEEAEGVATRGSKPTRGVNRRCSDVSSDQPVFAAA